MSRVITEEQWRQYQSLLHAAQEVAGLDFDHWPGSLTCGEAEAIAGVMLAGGHESSHDEFLEAHSWGDDDWEDMHYDPAKQEEGARP